MTLGSLDSTKPLPAAALPANPKAQPAAPATLATASASRDSFQAQLQSPTQLHPVVSHLQLRLEDKDGLANFGQNDIKASVSGDIQISPQFLLSKLSGLKSDKEKVFHKPSFDPERRQYVISGTAVNKILGLFDIGFEIRLGVFEGKLAFRVDSGLKRGSIYEDLEGMLKEQGLSTYEKDGLLFIKPEYKQTIQLPALGDQPARIDKLGANADNLKFEIAANGQIKVTLKQLPLELSSQQGVRNPAQAKADSASLQLDLGFDKDLNPTAQIRDGQLQGRLGQRELTKYLPEAREALSEQLGTALSVSLTGLRGQIRSAQQGLVLNTAGQVKISSLDGKAQVSAGLDASLNAGKAVISARNADIRLLDGTQVKAAGIDYDGRQAGLNLKVRDLDGQLRQQGLQAELSDFSGSISRSDSGLLKASLSGQTRGQLDHDGVKAAFTTSGAHSLNLQGNRIRAEVEQASLEGSYQQPEAESAENEKTTNTQASSEAKQIFLDVRQFSAKGKVSTSAAQIEAQASQGSLQLEMGQGVTVKTSARLNLSAQGERVQGQASLPQGAQLRLDEQGRLKVEIEDAELQGKFNNPGKLKVEGQLDGDLEFRLGADGKIQLAASDGQFDARFALKDKVKVSGKGQSIGFELDKQENISLDLGQTQATTEVSAGKTRLKATTSGQRAQVSVINDDVNVQTTGTKSKLTINVNDVLQGSGSAGDVSVKVDSEAQGDDIRIKAQQADVQARVQNKKGNLKLGVDAKAELEVHVDRKDNVEVSSRQARSKVDLTLSAPDGSQDKIQVKAQGTDFKVNVRDDDKVAVELQKASFNGRITPNPKMAVEVESTQNAAIQVSVDESQSDTQVDIHSKSAVKGKFQLEDKISAGFSNPAGFDVQVKDKAAGTDVTTRLKQLELKGQVQTPEARIGVGGKGDFELKILDDEDVKVLYDGHLLGDLQTQDLAQGSYGFKGRVSVDVTGSDVNLETSGALQGQLTTHGVGADISVNGQSSPIRVQVKDNQLSLNIKEGGQIQVKDLKQLRLGQPDPTLAGILSKLESNQIWVNYSDLKLKDQGQSAQVKLETDEIRTTYGKLDAQMQLEKEAEHVYVTQGSVGFEPNLAFYELIQDQINQKYNIRLSGTPSFKNGELKLQGELRSKTGLVQLADFSIKARVLDNKLVFELDKAQILKVIGKGTIGDLANSILSKTDIDVFRKGPGSIEIALADIVKDLALTQGVNFTELKLVDNRFEVGFRYNSSDLEVAKLAKNKDLTGLKRYLGAQNLASMSGESLSTAYNTYLSGKDQAAATDLLLKTLRAYGQAAESGQLERALLWMSKSQVARKADLNDDIILAVLKQLQLGSPEAKKLVEALPPEIVQNLANSLDQTISQGGGWSWISGEERELANQLRALKGLPLNHRII